jgi:hypothetical protein
MLDGSRVTREQALALSLESHIDMARYVKRHGRLIFVTDFLKGRLTRAISHESALEHSEN